MTIKLGGVHSEDTSSFFMESSSQQGTPSLCTGTNMLLESLGRGRGRLGMLQAFHISTQPDTKDSSAHLQLMGLQLNKASGYTVVLSLGKVCTLTHIPFAVFLSLSLSVRNFKTKQMKVVSSYTLSE